MPMHFAATSIAPLVLLLPLSTIQAQLSRAEPTPQEVAQSLRTTRYAPGALRLLTQASGSRSRVLLDEVADTLVKIAAEASGEDVEASAIRKEAVHILIQAAAGQSGVVGAERATAYEGAEPRLMMLVASAADVGIRGMALAAVQRTGEPTRVLAHLERTALLDHFIASAAVSMLLETSGPEGIDVARRLHREGKVTNERARRFLRRAAEGLDW